MDLPAPSQFPPVRRPTLSVVIVNHKSWDDIERIVPALLDSPEVASGRCEVIVVDNASGMPVPERLAAARPGLVLLLGDQNTGFASGVNTGWRASRGRWLLLLNPDVLVPDGMLARVMERIEVHERSDPPGIIGFRLLNADGTVQPSVGYDPSLLRSLGGLFIPRPRRKYQADRRHRAGPVPWVTGACALVGADLMRALGGMDEDFFLYYEEVALCRSARMLGRRVEYDPTLGVTHLRPLQNRRPTPELRVITRQSKLLYFSKFVSRWQFIALSWIVGLEAGVRTALAHLRGRDLDARAWRIVGRLSRDSRRGHPSRGTAVRDLAASLRERETVSAPAVAEQRAHRLQPAREGPTRVNAADRRS